MQQRLSFPGFIVLIPLARLGHALGRLHERLAHWRDNARGRRQLAAMDRRALKDIGLTRVGAWREVNKSFWED